MAINIDHTSAASLTLKGPEGASDGSSSTFVFPITSTSSTLLISGEATIGSISGLNTQLSAKVDKIETGSAASLNTGITFGTIPILNAQGKLDDNLISSVAIKDVFIINESSELTGLANACIGDTAIATGSKCNYILSSSGANAYLDTFNWKPLKFKDQLVTSVNGLVGDVVLDGSNIYLSSGYYATTGINVALECVIQSKASSSSLINYVTNTYLSNCLSCFEQITGVNAKLSGYVTSGFFSGCLANYSTTLEISGCLDSYYVPISSTGSAASRNIGFSSGDVIALNSIGKIPDSVLPSLVITDTFFITGSEDLVTLTSAQKGDIAINTGAAMNNYILAGSGDYANASDWIQLSVPLAPIAQINSVQPVNGYLTLTAQDIPFIGNSSVFTVMSGLSGKIDFISGDYINENCVNSILTNYVTTGELITKSDVGHVHDFCEVNNLMNCLSCISAFYYNSCCHSASLNSSNPLLNQAEGLHSLAIGYGAKASQDYEIAHAAGIIFGSNVGDMQSSRILFKEISNSDSLKKIATVKIEEDQVAYYKANILGKTSNTIASFKLQGVIEKTGSYAWITNPSCEIFSNQNNIYAAVACSNGTYGTPETTGHLVIYVSGDPSNEMRWLTDIEIIKIKSPNN